MNQAAAELVIHNPSLLHQRQELLEQARLKVYEDGYVYKKGHSRSKLFHQDTVSDTQPSKRMKTSESMRLERIQHPRKY